MSCGIPERYVFMVLIFSGMFILTMLRTNLSIAIILMVKPILPESAQVHSNASDVCPGEIEFSGEKNSSGILEWTSVQQGTALGCSYYGSIISSALGPWAAKRLGVKLVVAITIGLCSIFTLLAPLAATYGFWAFVAVRILAGFFYGSFFTTSVSAIPYWFAPEDHTTAYSIVASGYSIGYFSALNICSLIAEYLDWEPVFYITGSIALVWSILWFALMYNTPDDHPRISDKESEFLRKAIPKDIQKSSGVIRIPWFQIAKSLPYLAINLSRLAQEWTFGVNVVILPVYLATVLKMNMTMVGISSSLPFLCVTVVVLLGSKIVDVLRHKTTLSLTTIRKIIVLTALLGSGTSGLMASYASCNKVLAVAFFICVVQLSSLHAPGTEANVFDLSPIYCGILLGVTFCVTGTCGFLAPLVAGYILDDNNTLSGWRTLFWITAGINSFAAVFYLIFGSAEEQPWSRYHSRKAVDKEDDDELKSDVNVAMLKKVSSSEEV